VDANLGFDDAISNEGGKSRKWFREKKVKEIISEAVAPSEKNFDVIKLYFTLCTKKKEMINLSDLTKNKFNDEI